MSVPEEFLLRIMEKNMIRNCRHRFLELELKPQLNRLQHSLKFALFNAESSHFHDFIAEIESIWKVTKSRRNKKLQVPALISSGTRYATDLDVRSNTPGTPLFNISTNATVTSLPK